MTAQIIEYYLSTSVMRITGATERQINHWTQTGLITPGIDAGLRGRKGGRQVRRWSFADIVSIRTLLDLRQAGIPLQALRKVNERLAKRGEDFADTYLVVNGSDVLIRRGDQLESTLKSPGQLTMYALIYDVARAEKAVRAALAAEAA